MNKWFVFVLAVLLSLPVVSGCGQKQDPMDKTSAIKPVEVTSENEEVDTEEESVTTNAPEQAAKAAAGSAAQAQAKAPVAAAPAAAVPVAAVPVAAAPAVEAPKPSETLVLADFNSGEKPNNVGGNFGAWNKDPSDPTQWCKEGFDNVVRHGDTGFAMKLDYSVDSPNPAYNGFWMMLPNLDASKYDTVNLWVKGDPQAGFTTVFKIEIKNANRQVGRYYVSNVSEQWQQVSIPLSEFKGLIDKTSLTEFVIVFEDRMATKKKGVIYIDDISFTKK